MKMSLTVYSSGRRQELDGEDSRRQGPPKVYVSHGLQRPSGGPGSGGSSDRAGCHGFSRLQPLCNLSVEHKMKLQIRFIKHTPSPGSHETRRNPVARGIRWNRHRGKPTEELEGNPLDRDAPSAFFLCAEDRRPTLSGNA